MPRLHAEAVGSGRGLLVLGQIEGLTSCLAFECLAGCEVDVVAGAGVGPAVGQGSVGALDLAAGLGPMRPCALVLDAQFVAGVSPQV